MLEGVTPGRLRRVAAALAAAASAACVEDDLAGFRFADDPVDAGTHDSGICAAGRHRIDALGGPLCLPERPADVRWAAPAPLDVPHLVDIGPIVLEGSTPWLYFTTDIWGGASVFSDLVRVPLLLTASTASVAGPIERLTAGDIADPVTGVSIGWNGAPRVANRGTELFFAGSRPDADWHHNRLYMISRESATAPWSLAASQILAGASEGLSLTHHTMLPDNRTLLYVIGVAEAGRHGALNYAVRSSTRPDDIDFEPRGVLPIDQVGPLEPIEIDGLDMALTCDGWHLLYEPNPDAMGPLWLVEFTSFDPPQLGQAEVYSLDRSAFPRLDEALESDDCSTLYLSINAGAFVARRAD
jgi:hypothetical protein